MSKKATEEKLNSLHDKLADEMAIRLREGEVEFLKNADGDIVEQKVRAKPATLNVIRQFLKDNGIEGVAEENTPLNNLATKLRDMDVEAIDELAH